ncbi:MAG: DUF4397 domain-containing protein [Gammaproteobacteria bacterium]|nr:DUF4397 domain-containing protein [Gammaproteobacteria bacterium]
MTQFRTGRRRAILLVATVILASCGGGGSISNELSLRIIQASPDAPLVNFLIDGKYVRQFVNYRGGWGAIFVTPGTYDFAIEAILPGADQRIVDRPETLAAGKDYTFIVIGKDADDSVQLMEFESPIEDVPAGNVRVQVAHAAPDVDPVDVYLTAPGDILPAAVPIARATYGNDPDARQLVPAGTYVISVTPAGMPDTVLFESGAITLQSGRDLLLVAVANTTTAAGSVPISLVVNELRVTADILDKDLPSDLRVVHVSPDAPALDVVGDPATEGAADVPFASGLTYLANTGYISVPPDNYLVNGATTAEPDTVIFSFGRFMIAGQKATALAIGQLATINTLVLADDTRPVYAEGRLRFVNAAPGSGVVDVYILETGTPVESATTGIFNFGLGGATAHLGYEPGNYTVTFTMAGDKTMVLATAEVAATAGTVHTAILVDAVRVDENSDGKPPAVLLIDDLAG